jgi:hypothetical protein
MCSAFDHGALDQVGRTELSPAVSDRPTARRTGNGVARTRAAKPVIATSLMAATMMKYACR